MQTGADGSSRRTDTSRKKPRAPTEVRFCCSVGCCKGTAVIASGLRSLPCLQEQASPGGVLEPHLPRLGEELRAELAVQGPQLLAARAEGDWTKPRPDQTETETETETETRTNIW